MRIQVPAKPGRASQVGEESNQKKEFQLGRGTRKAAWKRV
jgi:hypothetical protein